MHRSRTLQSRTDHWLSSWLAGQGNSLHCTNRLYSRLSTEQPSSVRYSLKSFLLFPVRNRRTMQSYHLFFLELRKKGHSLEHLPVISQGLHHTLKRVTDGSGQEDGIILGCCFNILFHESSAGWFLWCLEKIIDVPTNSSMAANTVSLHFSGPLSYHFYLYLQH